MKTQKIFWFLALILLVFSFQGCKKDKTDKTDDRGDTVVDKDGNVYHLVTIGNQVWTVENLRTRHYQNGDPIQNGSGIKSSSTDDTTATFWAYDNNSSYILDYGLLYNWYAANDARNIAPIGFHVPSDEEFGGLVNSLGGDYYLMPYGDTIAGSKLKEEGTDHWGIPGDPGFNVDATNSSKWSGRGGGCRYLGAYGYIFRMLNSSGVWWSTTSSPGIAGVTNANIMALYENKKGAERGGGLKDNGFSVRCIKNK